jgi:MurNAc alpha-1-phosphate uridylyltransferase
MLKGTEHFNQDLSVAFHPTSKGPSWLHSALVTYSIYEFDGGAHAMLLAAGRGERMRPLTDHCPKPLLKVRGHTLLSYPLRGLLRAGVGSVVINTGWLGDQIEPALGHRFLPVYSDVETTPSPLSNGLQLHYSHEGRGAGEALETAGGILRALPLLQDVFWVAAGDVFAPDFDFSPLRYERFIASTALAHLWLVPNPEHNPQGDFGLSAKGLALNLPRPTTTTQNSADANTGSFTVAGASSDSDEAPRYTFSTIALYKKAFFSEARCGIPAGNPQSVKAPLAPLLRRAMDEGLVTASLYQGLWVDVGTPERLALLNADG